MAHKTQVVVFDKTGTLTQGRCTVRKVILLASRNEAHPSAAGVASVLQRGGGGGSAAVSSSCDGEAVDWGEAQTLALLACVEGASEHPLAKAIVTYAAHRLAALQRGPAPLPEEEEGPPAADDAAALAPLLGRVEELEAVPGRGLRCHWTEAQTPSRAKGAPQSDSPALSPPRAVAVVVVGNLQWMQDCGVSVSEAARGSVRDLEAQVGQCEV